MLGNMSKMSLIIEGLHKVDESVDNSIKAKLAIFCKKVGLTGKDARLVSQIFNDVTDACEYVSTCEFQNPREKFKSMGSTGDLTGVEFGIHEFLVDVFYETSVPSNEALATVESQMRKKYSGNVDKVGSGRICIRKTDDFDVIVQSSRGFKLIIGVETLGDANEGFPGTEIGLPLDRENCESTDASGISTPTGVVGDKNRKIILDDESKHIVCPECGSKSVNIHNNGTVFHCVDCGYEWSVTDSDNNGIEDDDENRDHFIDKEVIDKIKNKEDEVEESKISESYIEDRDGNRLDNITLHSKEWCYFYSDNGIKYTIHCVRGKMKAFKDGTKEVKPTKDMKAKVKVEE